MTDKRAMEIQDTGRNMVETVADLQLALQGGEVGQEAIQEMAARLRYLKEQASSLMRVNGLRFDSIERSRICCQNSLNGLRQQLDTINSRKILDDLALHRLLLSMKSSIHRVEDYLLQTMAEGADHAG